MNLHQAISEHFQLTDIRLLCADLGLDYDDIKGENKIERIIDIVAIFRKNGRLQTLQDYLQKERPQINWQSIIGKSQIDTSVPAIEDTPGQKDVPIQLPLRPEHFTGREDEIKALRTHLRSEGMVTLWAAGGMGKSCIAAETIHRLHDEGELLTLFPDGVIFFSFYGRSRNEELFEHIIHTFDPYETEFTFENCFRYLSDKRLLLIYDGSEEAADLKRVLQLQGQNGLLITTRDRRSYGGKRIEVGLLPIKHAIQLLIDWSGGSIDETEAQAICEEIGRLPLAIRIAGFYLDESGEMVSDYLEMLQDTPIRELSQGDSQYESVEILLKRTVNMLDEVTHSVLALMGRLALLPFGMEPLSAAVERRELRTALNQLNRYGLILRNDGQIQLTHALIHRYARRRLSLNKDDFIKMAWFFEEAARTESEKGLIGFQKLHLYRPHIMVVLKQCVALEAWEVANALVMAMARSQGYLDLQGFNQVRTEMLEIGVKVAQMIGDRQSEATHLGNLGVTYNFLGQVEKAIVHYKQFLSIAQETGNSRDESAALRFLGYSYWILGQVKEAISSYEQALAIARKYNIHHGEGAALNRLGAAHRDLGQFEKAISYLEESLKFSRQIGDKQQEEGSLNDLGNIYLDLGQFEQAIVKYEQALTLAREIADRKIEGLVLGNLGVVYRNLDQAEKAKKYDEQALAIAREIGDRQKEGLWVGNLGNTFRMLKQVEKAIPCYKESLTIAREMGDRKNEGYALGCLGNAYGDMGEVDDAIAYLEQALVIAQEFGYRKNEAQHAWELGQLFEESDPAKAVKLMTISIEFQREIGHPDAEADARRVAEIASRLEK